ncbi:glutaredoxin family protein, partial [Arthrospira platensis SPKY1]|nr:glutaredoxin family protein [Arthrospira platensis SPKY1]
MKETVTLYGTSACHLCEVAQGILDATLNPDFFTVQWVDIADSDELIERYGVRIPVLQRQQDGSELNWPFDVEQLIAFLSR